jgi:lysyl-tRNA synthetase class 2
MDSNIYADSAIISTNVVNSSTINRIIYDTSLKQMHVTFKNSVTYVYKDIPSELHKSFLESPSKGKFLRAFISGKYPYFKR